MGEVICGDCGLPQSFPDVDRCGQTHAERTPDDDQLIDYREIAEMCEVSPFAVHGWARRYDDFPPLVRRKPGLGRYGSVALYRRIDVLAWDWRRRNGKFGRAIESSRARHKRERENGDNNDQ